MVKNGHFVLDHPPRARTAHYFVISQNSVPEFCEMKLSARFTYGDFLKNRSEVGLSEASLRPY